MSRCTPDVVDVAFVVKDDDPIIGTIAVPGTRSVKKALEAPPANVAESSTRVSPPRFVTVVDIDPLVSPTANKPVVQLELLRDITAVSPRTEIDAVIVFSVSLGSLL